jgi:uncharacterized peroxidase-related enzyme
MLRLSPIEPNQVSKELQGMLDRGQVGFEEIPTFLKILAKSPAAALAYVRAEDSLAGGQLSEREREQIALVVAEINGSKYCQLAHSVIGKNVGLTEKEVWSARKATAPDPKTDQMLRFTQSVVLQRGEISDEGLCAIRKAGFSDAEVIEIVANIALNILTNYINILSKTEMDFIAAGDGQANALFGISKRAPA